VTRGVGFEPCLFHLNEHPNEIPEFEEAWLAAQECPDCVAWGAIEVA